MAAKDPAVLSEREKAALRMLLAGHDAKSIAATLGLSVYTVNDRLRDARRKFGVSSSREAARRLAEIEGGTPNIVGPKEFGGASATVPMAITDEPARTGSANLRLAWLTGGMLIMSIIIAAVALSTVSGTPNKVQATPQTISAAAERPAETEASAAARIWAGLLDQGQWAASWQAAGTIFKAQIDTAQWTTAIRSVREPLGKPSSRILQSAVQTTTLPGAPAGDYQVLQFQTRFANKPDAIETVVLSREQAGWRVNGYFIR